MLEINVNVKCPDLSLAAAALAAAINHREIAPTNPTPAEAPAHSAPALAASTTPTAVPTTVVSSVPATAAPTAPVPVAAPTSAPVYTMEQLAKAGADLAAQPGKMQEIYALLPRFGVQAITQVPPERYGELAMALRGLGAQL